MMSLGLRLAEHIHGHLGWLSTLALFHPAVLLRSRPRRALLAAALATGLVTLTGMIGVGLYPAYRTLLKPSIFVAAPAVGNAFERKEHLAMAVVALAWVGLLAHWAQCRDQRLAPRLSRIAFVAYAGAAALATVSAALGVVVAVQRSF
ncbi:MAG TPA: hypothetical protein VGF76_13515 [Polyangiaceae bacterium]|jgi:hypothetical protein